MSLSPAAARLDPARRAATEASLKAASGSRPSEKVVIEGTPSIIMEEEVAAEPPRPIVVIEVLQRIKDVAVEAPSGAEDTIIEAPLRATDVTAEAPSWVRDVIVEVAAAPTAPQPPGGKS